MTPEELKYTEDHEWVASIGADVVRIGITDYAQEQLGDVVFVRLPDIGEHITSGQAIGEVESTKSVSDIYAPLSGEVAAANDALNANPELVNSDPYGEGWMIELKLADSEESSGLLDADSYQGLTNQA